MTGYLYLQGASGNLIKLRSSAAQYAYLNSTGSLVSYVDAQYSNASGSTIIDYSGTDSLNNVNWSFLGSAPANFTWIGSGNWSNPFNWMGGVVPGSGASVVFSTYSVQNCTIDTNVNVASITINSGYTGTITSLNTSTSAVALTSNFNQSGGTFNLSGGTLTVIGNMTDSGGTFNAGSGEIIVNGTLNTAGGTLNANTSAVILASTNSVTFMPGGQTYNNLTINDGLVGYWKFNETSAGTFADSSGYGNTGTGIGAAGANNTPQPATAVPTVNFANGESLSFDGTDDVVTVAGSNSPLFQANSFTVMCWVYINAAIGQYVVDNQIRRC